MLFSYMSPVYIAISYKIYFALLNNMQFIPVTFYPSTGGRFTFWFNPPAAYSWVCVPLTPSTKNPPHRSTIFPPPQNCSKSPHNSINHFDTDFDAHQKYPSTNTNNKLSDNLKTTQNAPNPQKITPNPNFKPNIYTQFFHYYSLQNPLNQAIF